MYYAPIISYKYILLKFKVAIKFIFKVIKLSSLSSVTNLCYIVCCIWQNLKVVHSRNIQYICKLQYIQSQSLLKYLQLCVEEFELCVCVVCMCHCPPWHLVKLFLYKSCIWLKCNQISNLATSQKSSLKPSQRVPSYNYKYWQWK